MKIGMGQMLVEAGDLEGNLHRAAVFSEEAQQLGCEILVLPECCDLGWANPDDLALAEPVPGKTSEWFRSLAMRCQLYLAAGLSTGLGAIGGGIALASGAHAAIGAVSEDPKTFGKALTFCALGETMGIYGVVVSFVMILL